MTRFNLTHALHRIAAATIFLAGCCSFSAQAEQAELRIAKQYGLAYLQMMVMEDQKIIEKNAKAAGLGDLKVTWATFRSSDVMNDALLSSSVDFVCLGIPGIATIPAIRNNSRYSCSLSGEIINRTFFINFTLRKAGFPRISCNFTGRGNFSNARKSATRFLPS